MSRTQVTLAIAFTALAVALVLGIAVFGVTDATTPFVTTVLGFISVSVTSMLAANKAEKAETTVTELNQDLRNGTFERLVREALEKIAHDPETRLEITTRKEEDI